MMKLQLAHHLNKSWFSFFFTYLVDVCLPCVFVNKGKHPLLGGCRLLLTTARQVDRRLYPPSVHHVAVKDNGAAVLVLVLQARPRLAALGAQLFHPTRLQFHLEQKKGWWVLCLSFISWGTIFLSPFFLSISSASTYLNKPKILENRDKIIDPSLESRTHCRL